MKTHRRRRRLLATVAASIVVLLAGSALAQDKPAGCVPDNAPEKVAGRIVHIDPEQGKLTLREANGTTYDFQASAETLRSYKVGDRIEATRRRGEDCPKSTS